VCLLPGDDTYAVTPQWNRYVALGDSTTEGFRDPIAGVTEPLLGWADRLAMILDGNARLRDEHFAYTNLAARGRRIRHVVADQVPRAIELQADLVSIVIGGRDLMTAQGDPDELASEVESGVRAIRATGADVLLATCFDPRFGFFLKPLRDRAAVYNANLWSIARNHGTFTLDLWGARELQAPAMWAEDRVHLAPAGHRLLACKAAHSLGVPYYELAAPGGDWLPGKLPNLTTVTGRQ